MAPGVRKDMLGLETALFLRQPMYSLVKQLENVSLGWSGYTFRPSVFAHEPSENGHMAKIVHYGDCACWSCVFQRMDLTSWEKSVDLYDFLFVGTCIILWWQIVIAILKTSRMTSYHVMFCDVNSMIWLFLSSLRNHTVRLLWLLWCFESENAQKDC